MSIALLLSSALLIGAPTPSPSPDPRLVELVRQLGAKSYRVREDAARELLRHGAAALAALTEGTKDTDPEVSERCRQLLPQAASLERNEKLNALLKEPLTPLPKGLAGLDRFIKITGDSKEARQIYAEMMSTHHAIIEAADVDAKKAAEQYRQFCDEAYNRWYTAVRAGRGASYENMFAGRADVTFFLFVSGDQRLRKLDAGAVRSANLLNGTLLTRSLSDKESTIHRKLFVDWLENESNASVLNRAFQLAAQHNLKEALPVALRLLEKKEQQSFAKAQVMTALVRLGSKEHIRHLAPIMDDKSVITTVNFGNGPALTVQLRDVAMGVSAQLAGQTLASFGFDTRFGGGVGTSYIYYGFPDDKARDEAHAKWKEWSSKNLLATGAAQLGPAPRTVESAPAKK